MPIQKICAQCSTAFTVKPSHAEQRFCQKACVTAYEAVHGREAAQLDATEFKCRECSAPFFMKPSYVRAYRNKHGKDPLYCSMPCSDIGRRKDTDERHKTTCKNCNTEFYRTRRKGSGTIYQTQQLCSKQCKNEWVSKQYRERNGLPQVTRRVKRKYAVLRIPAQNGNPVYEILEHRHVMEQHVGRKLRTEETVHHINGDRFDNSIQNLELFSSRHGPGQRVVDKVAFAIEILTLYPDFARDAGVKLVHVNPSGVVHETQ